MMSAHPPERSPDASDKAFLSFSLGPVQTFIASARSIRDLWTGSYLLAWLTRRAMQPIFRRYEAAPIITPDPNDRAILFYRHDRRSPCLPNRFLAEVLSADAEELARRCEGACRQAWLSVCRRVRRKLASRVKNCSHVQQWDRLWDRQLNSFLDIRTAVLQSKDYGRTLLDQLLAEGMRAQIGTEDERLWTDRVELVGNLLAAGKLIRHIPEYQPEPDEEGHYPQKCFILGTYEQMGPAGLEESRIFWETFAECVQLAFARTRKRERLCAVSLVKRYAWTVFFAPHQKAQPTDNWFEDTAGVAAAKWYEKNPDLLKKYARERYSSQWLHWSRRDQGGQDEDEPEVDQSVWKALLAARDIERPPAYYAILTLDGDKMGDKFRAAVGKEGHRAISSALSEFAIKHVPAIVGANKGTLVYSGGDDGLVLVPTATALLCARQLEQAFAEVWKRRGPPQPGKATLSAGIAVAHFKEDLRFVLDMARRAEKAAKDGGRNAIMLTVCRRSGEHTSALCPWAFVDVVLGWVTAFEDGASDRWAYSLVKELPTLRALPVEAMRAELVRELRRAESDTRTKLPPDTVAEAFDVYLRFVREDHRKPGDAAFWKRPTEEQEQLLAGRALKGFLTLCQSASFLARGRDQ
jgi:CRISPR-associated protein Cmr2